MISHFLSEHTMSFKSFVSESALSEAKQRRQEEWERNRRPDQPAGERHCCIPKQLCRLVSLSFSLSNI